MGKENGDNRFVFEALDPITQCVCAEWRVRIPDADRLRSILAPESDDDPDLSCHYHDLTTREAEEIGRLCDPPIVPLEIFTTIGRPFCAFDDVPYLIHTGFELALMLEGRKPLAVFMESYPSDWFDDYLAPFEPFVISGHLVRRVLDKPMPHLEQHRSGQNGVRSVLFALPEEAWRIDTYIENVLNRTRDWDDDLERLEGSLLGYEDWQNDWWIEHRKARREKAET